MASIAGKEKQLACLVLLYKAINETCKVGENITYTCGVADEEVRLSDTELFLCKLAKICDSQKGGDTITALVCLQGEHDGLEYVICSNNRHASEMNECAKFLTKLLAPIITNPDVLQVKALRKQVLWRILKFNIGRVGLYLRALFETVDICIKNCYKLGEGHDSPALKHLLAIDERCKFEIDMGSTENSEPLFLSKCETLINIAQDAKQKGLGQILDSRARIPENSNWSQLRHLLGRLHSYRQAADTIIAASVRRPELFLNFTVRSVSSAPPARSQVPRNLPFSELLCLAFPDEATTPCPGDVAELEFAGLPDVLARLQRRHRTKTTVHCEVLLHSYLHDRVAAARFLDGAWFIATRKPPCKLCDAYLSALNGAVRLRAPHLNIYPRWRLPHMETEDCRADILEGVIEQM